AFTLLNRLEALVLAERWPEVVRDGALGLARLDSHEEAGAFADSALQAEAYVAIAQCRTGAATEGGALAARARARLAEGVWPDRARHALVAEAEAECRFAAGDLAAAREALARSRAEDPHLPPGDARDLARRDALGARIAAAGGD
ncbi:MAG TPA: hypothetical protein VFQ84_11455, partial [Arenimonas sp.]|uniref:hypothetical protein n=1 Tax=Arenimonas sp. TaxID=1872635 RepID=UPI002D7EE347